MTARRTPDKAGVTPEIVSKGTTPRSRKCLDMNPRASPLSERSYNLPSPLRTPSTAKHFCPDSPSSSNRQVLSPGDGPGSSSPLSDLSDLSIPLPSNVIDSIPSIIPKTPQPQLRRLSSGKQVLTPLLKTTMKTFSIEKIQRKEEAKITVSPALASIVSKSFYSSGSRTPQSVSAAASSVSKQKVKHANPKRKSAGSKGSLKHHRSRSSGGKRKRTGTFGFGGGHAIKKPKLNKSIETKPVKISELPVPVMVDLPSSSSSYKETMPKTPGRSSAIATPTSGSLTMSGTTKVQFECKAGQFVFRAKAKTATTPLRRSPRKHMSPLKNDYFSNSGSKKNKMKTSGKLFSPESNYLRPEKSISSEGANIPSPVKFVSETDDDLGDLISSLARDQAIEISVPVSAQPVSSLLSTTNEFPDVSDAVNNILNDLSSGDDNDSVVEEVLNPPAPIIDNTSAPHGAGSNRLFSIFYKNAASCSDQGMPNNASLGEEKKKFVCSSLSENQAIIDAGQRRMGPVQCATCGGVYSVGDPEEEAAHTRLHQGRLEKLKLPGWKNERAVGHFPSGRVLCIKPGDHATHWRKVDEVLSVVDSDLGFSEVGIRWPDKTKVFMYVADKKVVGLLLAETIDRAYRIIPNNGVEIAGKVFCCSEQSVPVRAGISRIWVLADFRRGRVASCLVDCMRASFYLDHYLDKDEFAFSDPTLDGISFASKYMQSNEFLVYNR